MPSRNAWMLAVTLAVGGCHASRPAAALEQTGSFGGLRPAIILDADETVLDNLAYQARLIVSGTMYAADTWDTRVEEAAATAIPGRAGVHPVRRVKRRAGRLPDES